MTLAELAGGDAVTLTFRITVLVAIVGGAITVAAFLRKLLGAIRDKARLEQRVQTHLDQTEPLIAQFNEMQRAVASGESRHQQITDRIDRYIETQDETNRELKRGIDRLTEHLLENRA